MPNNFYDEGWNARVSGGPFTGLSSRSWRDGWKDCDGVPLEEQTSMDAPLSLDKRRPRPSL